MPNPTPGIGQVPLVAGNHVDVQMGDSLTRHLTCVEANVVPIGSRVLLIQQCLHLIDQLEDRQSLG